MKKILTLFVFSLIVANSYAVVSNYTSENPDLHAQVQELGADFQNLSAEDFLTMTPKRYKEMTGKKLGIKNAIKLKAAQKIIKKKSGAADISEGIYILLAILGLGWLAMGLLSDWSGSEWIIALVLSLLCWLPGLIYALVKKSDYY